MLLLIRMPHVENRCYADIPDWPVKRIGIMPSDLIPYGTPPESALHTTVKQYY